MDTIKTAKDLMNKYSEKSTTQNNKKIHPALAAGKEQERKILIDIFNITKSIFQRQSYIKQDTENILRSLNNFNKLGVKSQIPFITPRQLYAMYTRGWSLDEMSAISGYTAEDIDKKLKSYNQNYVAVNK